jgi:hypothetical protein
MPLFTESSGKVDTLSAVSLNNGTADLSSIDPVKYPSLKILAKLSGTASTSPVISTLGVNYTGLPELGVNYQTVSVSKDTVQQGENFNLLFNVLNVGY